MASLCGSRRRGAKIAIDERSRHELYLRLEEALGPESATTLMEHLPPVGWADVATKRDLEAAEVALRSDLDHLATKQDLNDLRIEFERFRGDFRAELAAQTQAMFFAIVSIVLTMSGLTFALAR